MEPYYAGALSILPPIIAVVLALITKEVFSSLLLGILTGSLIYTIGSGSDMVIVSTVENTFKIMVDKVDFNIILFCSLLGALVYVISMAGGSRAYGKWAAKKIKGRRSALLSTSALGAFIFIDDYFNCLTVGTVMRPITDTYRISRAKLAYIIDATAAPICIIAPISSWAAAVGSNLKSTGAFESEMEAFISTIPWNFYALLCIIMVIMVSVGNFDFGPMRRSEIAAINGESSNNNEKTDDDAPTIHAQGTVLDMVVPILALIVFATLSLLYCGGYWGEDPAYHTIAAAFGNTSAGPALVIASFAALLVAFIQFVGRRLFLETQVFIGSLVQNDAGLAGNLMPAIIFAIASFLSFSTGTAWGTFGILIPIVVTVAQAIAPSGELTIIALSATLAGSVFGDHCSPISDTTILSSAGSGCVHIEHVSTQLPYACITAISAFIGYVIAGLTLSLPLSLGSAIVVMVVSLTYLHLHNSKRESIHDHYKKATQEQ